MKTPPAAAAAVVSGGDVAVAAMAGRRDLKTFLELPWRVYRGDPAWVPPLLSDQRKALDPARHPFHRHAEVQYFLARRAGVVTGRIAAILNHGHVRFHEERCGFFGLFEALDEASARALFRVAEAWLRERGMERIRGPMNFSTNDELFGPGFLIEGADTPPFLLMGHSPVAYARYADAAGYAKSKDLYAYMLSAARVPPRLVAAGERLLSGQARLRRLDMHHFDEEVARVIGIYNAAWERNWGFVPMTPEELRTLARDLRPIIRPELCVFAEIEGETVGFGVALPDFNQVLRHLNGRLLPFGVLKLLWYRRRIDQARVFALGVKPGARSAGLASLLYLRLFNEARAIGIRRGECSWILEDNWPMRRGLERMGGRIYKTYRVFEKPL